jgi:Tfp pilus assembly protein PilV
MRKGTGGHLDRHARRGHKAARRRFDEEGHRRFDEDGIGLIEILVAFIVFMIAFLPILRFLPVGSAVIVNSNNQRTATEIANTLLSNAQSSMTPPVYDPNTQTTPTWSSVTATCIQRTDTASYSSSSSTITDATISASDVGALVSGANLPSPSYVGTVTPGVGAAPSTFVLSSSPDTTVAVAPTGSGTAVSLVRQVNCTSTSSQDGETFQIFTLGGWCAFDPTATPPAWTTGTVPSAGQPSYHLVVKVSWGKGASATSVSNVVIDGTELSVTSGAPVAGQSVAACPLGVQ